ncbi:hypothetical protein [Actinopolymorpha pittospori]|uniref:Uncharacterized protein n=1 Tax=Actinopolymorpha pittospori TaxID=648752 RepID=A0A927MNU7_9ACTN|nr:hypothetical protein [Actinopolymorpha pittospori]MBE1604130.1 hypothetical protein [Actinopolymorpha pittospori]
MDRDDPGDARLAAFERVHLLEAGTGDDRESLAELRRDDASGEESSLYLHGRHHHSATITLTREGAVVLGLSLDDPFNSPDVLAEGTLLLRRLCQEFSATEGLAGVELPPPQSSSEWTQDAEVLVRLGPTDL